MSNKRSACKVFSNFKKDIFICDIPNVHTCDFRKFQHKSKCNCRYEGKMISIHAGLWYPQCKCIEAQRNTVQRLANRLKRKKSADEKRRAQSRLSVTYDPVGYGEQYHATCPKCKKRLLDWRVIGGGIRIVTKLDGIEVYEASCHLCGAMYINKRTGRVVR